MNDTKHVPSERTRDACLRRPVVSSAGEHRYCSATCRVVERATDRAQRVSEALGPSPATSELLSAVLDLSDSTGSVRRTDQAPSCTGCNARGSLLGRHHRGPREAIKRARHAHKLLTYAPGARLSQPDRLAYHSANSSGSVCPATAALPSQ